MLRGFALQAERRAAKLREFAGLAPTGRIDPLDVAAIIEGVVVFPGFDALRDYVACDLDCTFLEAELSALTVQIDTTYYIVENHTHTQVRRRVSLMEEFAHILLGHEPTTVSLSANSLLAHRTFNDRQEREAYALGAATLVPYHELERLLTKEGWTFGDAGAYYEVSEELIAYRAKITLLWRRLKNAGLLEAAK